MATVAIFAMAIPAVADAKKKGKSAPKVTVMTRNIYLGADLAPALNADTLAEAIDANGQILAEVDDTNFPERAVPLAAEIKDAKPDLIGLQEVAHWRQQEPSDLPPEFGGTEATDVRYDFLELLRAQLAGKGPKYKVVHVQEEFDQELPVDVDQNDATGGLNGADIDGRLTMNDVILVKKGSKVRTGATNAAHYTTLYEPDVGGVPLDVERGWQSVEAKVKQKGKDSKFRFINTHLEAFGDPTIREAQAEELIAGPADTNKQVILVGDINSGLQERHATGSYQFQPGDPLAFEAFAAAGFKDNGAKKLNKPYPQTCCGEPRNHPLVFDHTVDHVLTNPGLKTLKAFATGNDPDQRTPSGLYPSDHGGKVVKLKLKK